MQINAISFQTGVYIIDSPGFGENAAMDKMLMDYISANQIFAFIYVIKSDNAGGVQEDRVSIIYQFCYLPLQFIYKFLDPKRHFL